MVAVVIPVVVVGGGSGGGIGGGVEPCPQPTWKRCRCWDVLTPSPPQLGGQVASVVVRSLIPRWVVSASRATQ